MTEQPRIVYDPINHPCDIPPIVHIRTYYDKDGSIIVDPNWENTYIAIYLTQHYGSSLCDSRCGKLGTIIKMTKWWFGLQTLSSPNFRRLGYYNQHGVYILRKRTSFTWIFKTFNISLSPKLFYRKKQQVVHTATTVPGRYLLY